jgi:hypothetical protein
MGGISNDDASSVGVPAGVSVRRKQTALDVGASLILAILVWPFPLARAMLTPLVHVISILVLWQIVQVGYFSISSAAWRKTPGMHLAGLVLKAADGSLPTRGQAVRWGLLAAVMAVPRVLTGGPSSGRADLAERLSEVAVVTAQ